MRLPSLFGMAGFWERPARTHKPTPKTGYTGGLRYRGVTQPHRTCKPRFFFSNSPPAHLVATAAVVFNRRWDSPTWPDFLSSHFVRRIRSITWLLILLAKTMFLVLACQTSASHKIHIEFLGYRVKFLCYWSSSLRVWNKFVNFFYEKCRIFFFSGGKLARGSLLFLCAVAPAATDFHVLLSLGSQKRK